jgi:hypothetical protein
VSDMRILLTLGCSSGVVRRSQDRGETTPMGILRLLLAVWVAGGHAALFPFEPPNPSGAVIVFFAISGFLMTKVLTRPQTGRWISAFYLSRALRIFSALLDCADGHCRLRRHRSRRYRHWIWPGRKSDR